MKFKDLPVVYQKLAEKRKREYREMTGEYFTSKAEHPERTVDDMISWRKTPESSTFWSEVHAANHVNNLPTIPDSSLEEIDELNPNLKE